MVCTTLPLIAPSVPLVGGSRVRGGQQRRMPPQGWSGVQVRTRPVRLIT